MRTTASSDEIRRVRRFATGILVGLFAVFLATSLPQNPSVLVQFIHAMSEAGMVGGLADWFAVEALFRKPIGLPIPHTALLPANQKRAATNIARFIDEYFLDPEQLMVEIKKVDPIRKGGDWLRLRENAALIGGELSWAIRKLSNTLMQHGVPAQVKTLVTDALGRAAKTGTLPDRIADLMQEALDTEFLDEVLLRVREAIDDNRAAIVKLVQDRSRWWIASGVDRQVAELLVKGVLSVLDELRDQNSPRRAAFAASVADIIDRFREDGVIETFIDNSMSDYTTSPAFTQTLDEMLDAALREIDAKLSGNDETLQTAVTDALQRIGTSLVENESTHYVLTERLHQALTPVLNALRLPVRDYISQTIATWNSDELVSRIESEVGRDLQYIRINGSVLGSLLGGALFLFSHFIL